MSLFFRPRAVAAALALGLLARPAQAADPAEQIAAGRGFALKVCWTCHIVAADQTARPILSRPAPSFLVLAQRPDVTAESLRKFLSTHNETMGRVGQMPNPRLVDYQIDEVVAYILSLKK